MSKKKNTGTQNSNGVDLKDKEDHKIEKPKKYKVVFHNDDYTPMDFVILILMQIFKKSFNQAREIMLTVHEKDKGIAGIYPKEIAATKSKRANKIARESGYPLLSTIEPE
jgi:ATP-dependent Clp protease adaptor protein ClpS